MHNKTKSQQENKSNEEEARGRKEPTERVKSTWPDISKHREDDEDIGSSRTESQEYAKDEKVHSNYKKCFIRNQSATTRRERKKAYQTMNYQVDT